MYIVVGCRWIGVNGFWYDKFALAYLALFRFFPLYFFDLVQVRGQLSDLPLIYPKRNGKYFLAFYILQPGWRHIRIEHEGRRRDPAIRAGGYELFGITCHIQEIQEASQALSSSQNVTYGKSNRKTTPCVFYLAAFRPEADLARLVGSISGCDIVWTHFHAPLGLSYTLRLWDPMRGKQGGKQENDTSTRLALKPSANNYDY